MPVRILRSILVLDILSKVSIYFNIDLSILVSHKSQAFCPPFPDSPPPPGSFLVLTLNENFDVSNVKYRIRTSIRFFFRLSVSYVVPGIDFFVPLLVFQQDRLCCAQVSLPFQPFAGRHLAWSDGSDGDEHHNMPPIGRAEILSDTLCTRDKFVFFSFLRKVPAHFPLLPRRSMHTCLIRSECSRFLFRLFGGSSV